MLQHFVDKYNLLYVYPVNGSQHVRSGGQMGGTVHDLVLFSLCLMQYVAAASSRNNYLHSSDASVICCLCATMRQRN